MEIDNKTNAANNRLERQVTKLAQNLYECKKSIVFLGKKFAGDNEKPIYNKEAHMCLLKLVEMNYVNWIVTETKNGFFERANGGVMKNLIQVNGNSFKEQCSSCNQVFRRDTKVEGLKDRICDDTDCLGKLVNNMRLTEKGRTQRYQQAQTQMESADLVVCFDMDFSDIQSLQLLLENDAEFVFVNSEKTQYDDEAQYCIRADSSKVLDMLMKKIGFEADEFRLKRYLKVEYDEDERCYSVSGVDHNGYPLNYVNSIIIENEHKNVYTQPQDQINSCTTLNIEIGFEGHFNENDITIHIPKNLIKDKSEITLKLENDLRKWISVSPEVEEKITNAWDSDDDEKQYDFVTFENKLTESQIREIRRKENEKCRDKLDSIALDDCDQVLIGSSTDDTSVN